MAERWHRLLLGGVLAAALCCGEQSDLEQRRSHRHETWFWSLFDPETVGPATFQMRDDWVVARNLFFHVDRFYAFVPASSASEPSCRGTAFSLSTTPVTLPTSDVTAFYQNMRAGWVEGTTLWVDFPLSPTPDHLGLWLEKLAPLYSQLSMGAWRDAAGDTVASIGGQGGGQDAPQREASKELPYIRTVLFPGLMRSEVASRQYFLELLSLAVSPGLRPGQSMPRLLFQDDLGNVNSSSWLGFERALRIYLPGCDRPGEAPPGFATPQLAATFRAAVHAAANITAPPAAAAPPRTVTFLMASGGAPLSNNAEVLAALRAAAPGLRVRPYSPTTSVPLASLVAVMAGTGVLVGRNGPLLAAAAFLPPGAAVVELLPHNWECAESELYRNLTRSRGDVAHVAWRAPGPEFMEYESPADARYANWTPDECSGGDACLGAHERAALRVDVDALRRLAGGVAAALARGDTPGAVAAQHPWPERHQPAGKTGLWWDLA